MKKTIACCLCLFLLITANSCRQKREPAGKVRKPQVICTIFPLYDFSRAIAGDRAEVSMLLPPGMEAHSFEPKPDDLLRVGRAGLFVYTNPAMEPWAEDILKGIGATGLLVVDASKGATLRSAADNDEGETGHHHGNAIDPHLWLDFANAGQMTENILTGMVSLDPANAAYYRKNAEVHKRRLEELDRSYRQGLSECNSRTLMHGGHQTFGYLAARYGLNYIAASGISGDAEPTPARIAALVKNVRKLGVSTIFTEELISPRMAETIASESGAKVAPLRGAHNISRAEMANGTTFISLMEENLRNLRTGLSCR